MVYTVSETYQPFLVALSVALALVGSYSALDLAGRIRSARGATGWAWLVLASLALGGGVWSMHVVAMLALSLPLRVSYDPGLTETSVLLPIFMGGIGFAVLGGAGRRLFRICIAGLLIATGVVAMQVAGMAAMRVDATPTYHLDLIVASVIIAIIPLTAALWLTSRYRGATARIAAAGCMGLAVSAMHYVAIGAVTFLTSDTVAQDALTQARAVQATLDQTDLALGAAAATFFMLSLTLLASAFDWRLAAHEARALHEGQERFRTLYHGTPLPLHALDAGGRISRVSDAWLELLGYTREEVLGRRLIDFMTPPSAQLYQSESLPKLMRHGSLRQVEHIMITKSMQHVTVLLWSRIERDATGTFICFLGGLVDVTARRRAEEALRQAQKMEAVGQLTGGVAHDFNNLMTTILGSLDLLEKRPNSDDKTRHLLDVARNAVRRGSELTQGLLAFARRQPLSPAPVDANALLQEMATLVRRAVGETVTVELGFEQALPACRADAAQLQAAILNLVINARDAMPHGGTLCVRTAKAILGQEALGDNREAVPGPFVALSVHDSGSGMTPDVLVRAFEPFFTTKGIGRGTGLGLSQVYGFARQSSGHVSIESAQGCGTTVTIYLPIVQETIEATPQVLPATGAPVVRVASATVLVVEDDPLVRASTSELLREAGWRVLTAQDAHDGLRLLETGEPVDVVFTDAIIPGGITGFDLARAAQRLRPGIGILLTSGYAGALHEHDATEFELLAKPYEQPELLARLSAMTAGKAGAATTAA